MTKKNLPYVLILQHPQEDHPKTKKSRASKGKESTPRLGTATLLKEHLEKCEISRGLSWRNFEATFSKKPSTKINRSKWPVLYLGNLKTLRAVPPDTLVQIDRKGNPNEVSDEFKNDIEGLILLDGNWSQAKALWWRNPWLLKHPRLVFKPAKPSRYGNLRRTARKEALSTLEATASLLGFLGQLEVERELIQAFDQMLAGAK